MFSPSQKATNSIKSSARCGDGVTDTIRAEILSGVLPLGSRLRFDTLAARYGVSHMPVREALRELHGEGLVVIRPNQGARVREIDDGFVENVFDLRCALEIAMVRRAAGRCAPGQVRAMRAAGEIFADRVHRGDTRGALETNRALHDLIYRAADNPEAFGAFKRHWVLLARLFAGYGCDADRLHDEIVEHSYMIHAIERGHADAAAAAMTVHIETAKRDLLRRMRDGQRRDASGGPKPGDEA